MSAAEEGREFLAQVIWDKSCDWMPDDLDEMDDAEIEAWLEELSYEWTGWSWRLI